MADSYRIFVFIVLCCGFSLWEAGLAWCQAPRRPIRRYQNAVGEPFVSPYLNLARPGADPGMNYYTLVQPQLQAQRNTELNAARIQGLNQELRQQEQMSAYGPVGGIRPTGRGATYRNYSHFYPALGGGGGGGSPRRYRSTVGSSAGGFGVY